MRGLRYDQERRLARKAVILELALSGIMRGFSGRMLEVPAGTGVLTMPVYETLPDAEITCLDRSPDMMERAERQAGKQRSC